MVPVDVPEVVAISQERINPIAQESFHRREKLPFRAESYGSGTASTKGKMDEKLRLRPPRTDAVGIRLKTARVCRLLSPLLRKSKDERRGLSRWWRNSRNRKWCRSLGTSRRFTWVHTEATISKSHQKAGTKLTRTCRAGTVGELRRLDVLTGGDNYEAINQRGLDRQGYYQSDRF